MQMNIDAWNFTKEELRYWAFNVTDSIPDQDWELSVANSGFDELVLDLASDENCPNKDIMLSCLYMIVGDFMHSDLGLNRKNEIENLISIAKKNEDSAIKEWIKKTESVMNYSKKFEYDEWCWVNFNA